MAEIIRIPGEGEIVGDQFLLGKQIGRGGYGVVFEALQMGVERKVAVKMLLPKAMEDQKSVVDRFSREARLASSLTHPSSVTIFAFGVYHNGDPETLGLPYIAMEYLAGESLQEHLLRVGPLDIEETHNIILEVLGSLAEAHRKGIIHRDIKPDNVFLHQAPGDPRVIKVLDFGISMAFTHDWGEENRERLTETGLVTGTAEYMAPEQVLGNTAFTPAIDVYAVGCMAYQLLTGRFPYQGSTPVEIAIKHIYDPVPSLPEEYAQTFLGQVIMRAMSKDPRIRFKDASDFLEVLKSGQLKPVPVLVGAEGQIIIPAPSAEHAAPGAPLSRPMPVAPNTPVSGHHHLGAPSTPVSASITTQAPTLSAETQIPASPQEFGERRPMLPLFAALAFVTVIGLGGLIAYLLMPPGEAEVGTVTQSAAPNAIPTAKTAEPDEAPVARKDDAPADPTPVDEDKVPADDEGGDKIDLGVETGGDEEAPTRLAPDKKRARPNALKNNKGVAAAKDDDKEDPPEDVARKEKEVKSAIGEALSATKGDDKKVEEKAHPTEEKKAEDPPKANKKPDQTDKQPAEKKPDEPKKVEPKVFDGF